MLRCVKALLHRKRARLAQRQGVPGGQNGGGEGEPIMLAVSLAFCGLYTL
jgi:hypothetical protein